uniref:Uncharacterized protein n=1 Tax=uncultured marine virus TaxID=186617 RepID=A0A0F7LAS4_9VIRU|nr:hypothetical protein [uncultured marine virus]
MKFNISSVFFLFSALSNSSLRWTISNSFSLVSLSLMEVFSGSSLVSCNWLVGVTLVIGASSFMSFSLMSMLEFAINHFLASDLLIRLSLNDVVTSAMVASCF